MSADALDNSDVRAAPKPANRPKFWRYWRERDMELAQVGEQLERSREWVRLISLPFGHPDRRIPDAADVERIHAWSHGEIGPADWYPAELSVITSPPEPAHPQAEGSPP